MPMINISLTRGYTTIIDDIDADLTIHPWYAIVSNDRPFAVYTDTENKTLRLLHRLILERTMGRPLERTELADHIDGDPLNNIRANLRVASFAENARNSKRPKNNTSGYKGVWFTKDKRWRASIHVNNKTIHLGSFDTAEEAYLAYCEAAIHYHGKFARFD